MTMTHSNSNSNNNNNNNCSSSGDSNGDGNDNSDNGNENDDSDNNNENDDNGIMAIAMTLITMYCTVPGRKLLAQRSNYQREASRYQSNYLCTTPVL